MDISWTAVVTPQTGGSAITSYSVEYDNLSGGNTWTPLVGLTIDYTSTTYSVATGSLVPG
jgi:hypothetical protein